MTKSSDNLKKGNRFTKENAAEMGSKGGKASVEARRKKKSEKERFATLINLPLHKGAVKDIDTLRNFAALDGKNITVADAIAIRVIQSALRGDKASAKLIYSLLGEANPMPSEASSEMEDDGFVDALNGSAVKDWGDENE